MLLAETRITTRLALLGLLALVSCSAPRKSGGDEKHNAASPSAAEEVPRGTIESNPVAADAARDDNRHPEELMEFLAIVPGSRIVDIGAGDGYTSLYMARENGDAGLVYAHNTPAWRGFLKPYVDARLKNGPLAGIEWLETPFADPIPQFIRDVDLVTNILTYHDTIYYLVDRDAMNRNIFSALKSGGRYVVVDHAARDEDDDRVAQSLHRISEKFLIAEVVKAGFVVDETASFLRYGDDDRTSLAWTKPQPRTDRFVIAFRKP